VLAYFEARLSSRDPVMAAFAADEVAAIERLRRVSTITPADDPALDFLYGYPYTFTRINSGSQSGEAAVFAQSTTNKTADEYISTSTYIDGSQTANDYNNAYGTSQVVVGYSVTCPSGSGIDQETNHQAQNDTEYVSTGTYDSTDCDSVNGGGGGDDCRPKCKERPTGVAKFEALGATPVFG
jgi:hypothetical protein